CSSRTFASVRTPVAGARCAANGATTSAIITTRTQRVRAARSGRAAPLDSNLDVKLLRIFRSLHDETEPCRRIFPHQLVYHAVGHDLVRDLDSQQTSRS